MKEYRLEINGRKYNVAVAGINDGIASVTVNGTQYDVKIDECSGSVPVQTISEKPTTPQPAVVSGARAPEPESRSAAVKSPLPGVILSVDVKEGQAVRRGQRIAVLEAMKMENDILCGRDGTVREIKVGKGDSVLEGAIIALID